MLRNINFYDFMHRQIVVLITLFSTTAFSYVIFGIAYSSYIVEPLWYMLIIAVSYRGYLLYRQYIDNDYTIKEKEEWLSRLRYFVFFYFSTWIIIFVVYMLRPNTELHYLAIFTQLGVSVVATTILVSEKRLALIILVTSMMPVTVYLLLLGTFYGYVIAVLSVVLAWVLLYGSRNTYKYLRRNHAQAFSDYLTRLGNRRHFVELLEDAIKMQKNSKKYMCLILVDLDYFKTINDTLGHDVGDKLLVEVSNRMKELTLSYGGNISRLGGDEFCILGPASSEKEESLKSAKEFASKLLDSIKQTYIIDEHHLYISASIGVSVIDNPKVTANTLIKEADIAMYEAKARGRNSVIVFSDELSVRVERKLSIERLLHFAIESEEITLVYQPQVDTDSRVVGCEVLARWSNDELGAVYPDEFITISEDTGMIVELGHYILKDAFKTLKELDDEGFDIGQFSINISMRQILHVTFVDDVKKLCTEYLKDSLCKKIVFEMTETSVAEDIDTIVGKMESIKAMGIRFSMDDFGTGYSSLSYLSQIPIDEIKIDRSFISKIDGTEQSMGMIKMIINIAKNLNLTIVAEGVESLHQKDVLKYEQCDILQGYYFSKPLEKEMFKRYLAQNRGTK